MVTPANSQRETINLLQVDVGVIKAGQIETNRRLGNIENNISQFAFVKQSDFEDLRKDMQENYVKKESLRWIQYVVGGIAVGVGVALVVGVLKAIGANV